MDTLNDDLMEYLDACLAQLEAGATLDDCLAAYPDHAAQLRPLLEAALALEKAAPALPTAAQTERMQAQMMARLQANQKSVPAAKVIPISTRPIFKQALLAAGLVIVFGLGALLIFNQDENDPANETEAVVILPTEPVTQEIEETEVTTLPATAIAQAQPSATPSNTHLITSSPLPTNTPTSPPSPTETIAPSPTLPPTIPTASPPAETLAMPVFLDVTGEVEIKGEATTIAGVPIETSGELGEGDVVTVSGMLLDEGTLQVDVARAATIPEQASMPRCPVSAPDCDTTLLILSQTFEVPYQELAALKAAGLGTGEIARLYLLAEAGSSDIAALVELYTAGADWNEIIAESADTDVKALAQGVILGNGRGQTIRNHGNQPVYRGNSANAPGQQDRTPPANGNNGQGNQGNGNNGNGRGNSGTPPGQQNNPGNSGNAPGQNDNGPPGQSNTPPGQGNNGNGNNGNNGQGNQGNGNNGNGNNR